MNKIINVLNNKFFRNSLLYTIGSMATPFIGLLMLPFYTNYLSPAEYGVVNTIQTLVGFFQVVLLLALNGAVTRFFYDFINDQEKQKKYIGTIYIFIFIYATIITFILAIYGEYVGNLLFGNISIDPYYYYLLGISWINTFWALQMSIFRVQEKAGTFVSLSILKEVGIALFSIYLVVNLNLSSEGPLLAQLLITIIIVFITFFTQKKVVKLSFDTAFIKQSLIFSLPLLPHVASSWIIASSDRIILEKNVDSIEIGIYAIAVQFSMVLALFYNSINNAFVPRYTTLLVENDIIKSKKIMNIFLYIIIIFGIIFIPISIVALKVFTSAEYHEAMYILPILLIAQIFTGLYFIPVAKLFYLKKTNEIAISSTIAAIVNIIMNMILIPCIGIFGAAISAIISSVIRFLLILWFNKKFGFLFRHISK